MKIKRNVTIGLGFILLSLSGCKRIELGLLPTTEPTTIVPVMSEVLTEQSEAQVASQITTKAAIEGQQAVYHGDTYQFYEVDEALYLKDPDLSRYKIRSVYEDVFLIAVITGCLWDR